MPKKNLPSYRLHKASGQAIVTLWGKDHYLGVYKSSASREKYNSLIADFLANNGKKPPTRSGVPLTVAELCVDFLEWAAGYYVQNGKQTDTVVHCRHALSPVVRIYGTLPVTEFGPLSLKFVREKWVEEHLARSTVNSRVRIVKQCFAWGVENELVPSTVADSLRYVAGLKAGRSEARETEPVESVPDEIVEKTLRHCPPIIADMVQLQRLVGMRPQDVMNLRACDIDRSCDKAGVPRWNPNQLRHSAGTEVRDKFGLEFAQAVLGHANAKTTEIYAKASFEKAAQVAREIG